MRDLADGPADPALPEGGDAERRRVGRWGDVREILSLAVPATAALAADPLLGLVDTALVGRLGTAELAGMGVSVAVFTTAFVVFNVLTYGTTARVAQLVGAGQRAAAGTFTVQAIWASLVAGVLGTAVMLLATDPILRAMGADAQIIGPARDYLSVRALAAAPVLLVQVGHGALRGLKDTRTPLVITICVNVVNAVLSWALIYPGGMGVRGAALGTVIAQSAAAVTFLAIIARRLEFGSRRPDPAALRDLATISRDLFVRTASLVGGLTIVTAVAARMGAEVVAAHQVASQLWLLSALALDGFAIAGQAMVGTSLGAGSTTRARAEAMALTRWGLLAGVVMMLLYLPFGGLVPRAFTTDPQVIAGVGGVWLIVALLQPAGGVAFVLDGILIGAGDFTFLMKATAGSVLVGLLPLAALSLSAGWGLPGLWTGVAAMMAIRTTAVVLRLRGDAWSSPAAG